VGEGAPLPDPSIVMDLSPWHSIDKDRGRSNTPKRRYPISPFLSKTKMSHNVQKVGPANSIKCLRNIKSDEQGNDLLFMLLFNYSLHIYEAVMDAPLLDKSCLVVRNEVLQLGAQSVC
jgi:hypothetical protein